MRHTHGKRHSRVYNIWCGIKARCLNPNTAAYPNYGGRGITLCEKWREFPGFYSDMGDPPPNGTIERVDNDRGYEPGNCRWASRAEQNRNKRGLHLLTVDGETRSMGSWAEQSGLKVGTIWQRIKNGWSAEAAVKTPVIRDRAGKPAGYRWGGPSQRIRTPGGLTLDQIAAIKGTPKSYGVGRALASQYGVSEGTISSIRNGKRAAWAARENIAIKHFDDAQQEAA